MLQDNKAGLQKCLPRVIHGFPYTTPIWAQPKPPNFILIHNFLFLMQYSLKGQHYSPDREPKLKIQSTYSHSVSQLKSLPSSNSVSTNLTLQKSQR